MNVGTDISLAAAVLQLGFAATFLMLGRAPGWQRARAYALLAFLAGCYSAVDIAFTQPHLSNEALRRFSALNYFFGAANCAGWLAFAYAHPEQRWRDVPNSIRWLMALTVGLGLLGQVPGVLHTDEIMVIDLPSLGTTYRQSMVTPVATAIGAWFLIVLTIVVVRFARASRRGEAGARAPLYGFAAFFACAILEVAVTNGLFDFIYPADLGFLAVVAAMMTEALRRLATDAHRLAELSVDLTTQVESRTRERDFARDALAHAERLAAIGQLAAGAGHEINNPLTVVRGGLELLREYPDTPERDEVIADAIDGADRIARVIADLRAYSLPDSDLQELVDLEAVVRSARKLAAHQLRHVATVVEDFTVQAQVRANPTRLSQVFVNLLVNAGQAIEGSAQADPRVTIRIRGAGPGRVEVALSDNGRGISAETLARLGEPYFSTRVGTGGTGLGLFMSRGILASIGGSLVFTSELGRGTTATVELPATEAVAIAKPTRTTAPALPAARRILVVDDEPAVATAVARSLRDAAVTIAHGGTEAFAILDDDPDYDAIVCDLMMPSGSGIELHAALAAAHPHLVPRLVFLTGGAVTEAARVFLERPGVRHVGKPCERAALVAAVNEVSERAAVNELSGSRDRRSARRHATGTP